jgi:hypothetical protein
MERVQTDIGSVLFSKKTRSAGLSFTEVGERDRCREAGSVVGAGGERERDIPRVGLVNEDNCG